MSYEKGANKLLELYACLELAAKVDDNEVDFSRMKRVFRGYLTSKKRSNHILLTDEDFLANGVIKNKHRCHAGAKYNEDDANIDGDSLLLRAMSINTKKESHCKEELDEIIGLIIFNCPDLILFSKTSETHKYCGVTPVHLAILQEDKLRLELMEEGLKSRDELKYKDRDTCASGAKLQDTEMMAGTFLGVATLKFNEDIFCFVLKHFTSKLTVTNEKGDNIIHSLIKFAHVQPEKLQSVLKMLSFILDYKFIEHAAKTDRKRGDKILATRTFEAEDSVRNSGSETLKDTKNKWSIRGAKKLLKMKNKEKLNPLQLAAKRQQYRVFEAIIQHEVFHSQDSTDGLLSHKTYDVTEIETLPIGQDVKGTEDEHIREEIHESVLEYLIHHQTNNAFLFTDILPVKEVIREKWNHYRSWFMGWFFFHFVFMILLSFSAVYRSEIAGSASESVMYRNLVTKDIFVTFISALSLLFGFIYIVIEIAKLRLARFKYKNSAMFWKRFVRNFTTPYSNTMFRWYFILFSSLLISDFILAALKRSYYSFDYENYCLIFAVIIGWYLVLFFLQTFKSFSFFTVLIQRVILDMLKFVFVMGLFLIAFSVAMFMIMQDSNTEGDDFKSFSKTMVKMLTIMLGIGELDVLFQARQPILGVFVFVLYVLLTTILLLNALIALMSNSCTDLMSTFQGVVATKMHYRLQKLSVILYMESFFPRCLCKEVGRIEYKSGQGTDSKRRLWSKSAIYEQSEQSNDEPLLSTHFFEHFFTRNKKKRRKEKQNKILPDDKPTLSTELQRQHSVHRQVDIKDFERKNCEICRHDALYNSQVQEVTETFTIQ